MYGLLLGMYLLLQLFYCFVQTGKVRVQKKEISQSFITLVAFMLFLPRSFYIR